MPSKSISSRIAILAAVLVVSLVPGAWAAEGARQDILVLAFYYPWYDEASWASGRTSDRPPAPYNSDDPDTMALHIGQAQQAGIDAFAVNWWGVNNRTDRNLSTMLDVASGRGFAVSAVFDLNSPLMAGVRSYVDSLSHLLGVHATHPAYLSYHSKPVVFFYNVSRLPVDTWAGIRAAVDPDRQALWIAEGTDLDYQAVFDGHHLYSITWPNRVPPARTLATWGARVRSYARDGSPARLWVATVMPGYDDRLARPASGFARSRDGGDYYRECWRAAIASQPDWIVINSFNEWVEGTHIEPGQAYGTLYLEITAQFARQFRESGLHIPAAPEPAPAPANRVPTGNSGDPGADRQAQARPLAFLDHAAGPGCAVALTGSPGRWTVVDACWAGTAAMITWRVVD